jgi:hypothetical protein
MKLLVNTGNGGFTRGELALLCASVLLLLALAIASFKKTQQLSYRTECGYNLRVVHGAFDWFIRDSQKWITQVSTNNGGTMELSSDPKAAYRHFAALPSVEGVLACPKDLRFQASTTGGIQNSNISYFLSINVDLNNPQWILAGTRNISQSSEVLLPLHSLTQSKWHADFGLHGAQGYLVLVDGSVDQGPRVDIPIVKGTTNLLVLP